VYRSTIDGCVTARFKVALEKIPKTDIQVDKSKITIPANTQPSGEYTNFKVPNRDIQKMSEYFNKGSNPKTLANTVKDKDKAVARYYIAVSTGWKECEDSFYNRCIELGISEGDLNEIREKALKDKSINIGDTSNVSTIKSTKASSSSINKQSSSSRKTIDADTGFIITGDDSTPFS
jgi:hypothetical protein